MAKTSQGPVVGAANFLIKVVFLPRLKKLIKGRYSSRIKEGAATRYSGGSNSSKYTAESARSATIYDHGGLIDVITAYGNKNPKFKRVLNASSFTYDKLVAKLLPYV